MALKEFLTVSELASFLSISPKTVYLWVNKKSIPCYRFGSSIRFEGKEIKKWIESNKKEGDTF